MAIEAKPCLEKLLSDRYRTSTTSVSHARRLGGDFIKYIIRVRTLRPDVAILLLAAAIYVALYVYFVQATFVGAPVYDYLDWVVTYVNAPKTGDWLSYLWAPHNEHRIVLSRTLVAIDLVFFRCRHFTFIASGLLLLCAMLAATAAALKDTKTSAGNKTIALFAATFILFPTTIATLCSMAANQVFLHQAAFALFAICFSMRSGVPIQIAAVASATLAGLGGAGGLFVWPALILLAVTSDRNWLRAASYFAIGSIFSAFYFHDLPRPSAQIQLDAAGFLSTFDYFIRFFGLPWSHASAFVWPARFVGVVVIALGSLCLLRRPRLPAEKAGFGLIVFVFLIGAAAAMARSTIAVEREMPIRYVIFVNLMHLGILLASLTQIDRALQAHRALTMAAVTSLATVAMLQQVLVGLAATRETDRYDAAWTAFIAGKWTPEMEHYIYPDQNQARTRWQVILNNGLYQPR